MIISLLTPVPSHTHTPTRARARVSFASHLLSVQTILEFRSYCWSSVLLLSFFFWFFNLHLFLDRYIYLIRTIQISWIFFLTYQFVIFGKAEAFSSSICWFPAQCLQWPGMAKAEARSPEPRVSHTEDKDSGIWAIICCLSGLSGVGGWITTELRLKLGDW